MSYVDVTYFPFDWQSCPFVFGPWTHDETRIDMRLMWDSADMSEFVKSNTWDHVTMMGRREAKRFESTPNDPAYVKIIFDLNMRRCHKYGLMNFIIPCLIVNGMAVLVFILPSDAGEKIGLSITVLLTLVVFMQMLGDATPATADSDSTPVIATFFLITMVIVMGSTMATVMVLYMHLHDVNLQRRYLPCPFRYLFLVFLPKILRLQKFPCDYLDELGWFTKPQDLEEETENESENLLTNIRTDQVYSEMAAKRAEFITNYEHADHFRQSSQDLGPEHNLKNLQSHEHNILQILKELKVITQNLKDDNFVNEGADEWKYAAIVFDKCCLYLFSSVMVVASLATLGTAPGWLISDPRLADEG